MLFAQNDRYQYANSQLREVICQLRFPTILSINEKAPADFQEAIRDAFPLYSKVQERPAPKLVGLGTPNAKLEQGAPITNHAFVSSTGIWKINLTQSFIALSTKRYNNWEDFAQRLDRPLAEFIRIYQPAFFARIGLRYLNIFSRKALRLEGTPWRDLFHPAYLGVLAEEDVDEAATLKCSLDTELNFPDATRLKLHAGPGMLKAKQGDQQDREVKFILDLDCSASGELDGSQVPERLGHLHSHASRTFQGAITQELHDAMGATPLG